MPAAFRRPAAPAPARNSSRDGWHRDANGLRILLRERDRTPYALRCLDCDECWKVYQGACHMAGCPRETAPGEAPAFLAVTAPAGACGRAGAKPLSGGEHATWLEASDEAELARSAAADGDLAWGVLTAEVFRVHAGTTRWKCVVPAENMAAAPASRSGRCL